MRSSKFTTALFSLAGIVALIWMAAMSEKYFWPICGVTFAWTTWCCYRIWGDRRDA